MGQKITIKKKKYWRKKTKSMPLQAINEKKTFWQKIKDFFTK